MRACIGVSMFILAVGPLPLAARAPAQDLPTFRASVDVVPITAVVRDRRGRLVTNLKAADFEVLDHGERRHIIDFQVDDTGPVTVALLLDVSGSMRMGPKMLFGRQVLDEMVAELGNADEAALFTFDRTLYEHQGFTAAPALMRGLLDQTEPFGTTSLYDAVAATARRVAERPSRRRAVVVVTDGIDTSSALTTADVSGIASSIDVPVYVVVAASPVDRARHMNQLAEQAASGGAADLLSLAQWTGGDLLFTSAIDQAPSVARQIVNELRHQYVLAIESASRAEWRRLAISVRDRRLTVAARSGYFGRESIR